MINKALILLLLSVGLDMQANPLAWIQQKCNTVYETAKPITIRWSSNALAEGEMQGFEKLGILPSGDISELKFTTGRKIYRKHEGKWLLAAYDRVCKDAKGDIYWILYDANKKIIGITGIYRYVDNDCVYRHKNVELYLGKNNLDKKTFVDWKRSCQSPEKYTIYAKDIVKSRRPSTTLWNDIVEYVTPITVATGDHEIVATDADSNKVVGGKRVYLKKDNRWYIVGYVCYHAEGDVHGVVRKVILYNLDKEVIAVITECSRAGVTESFYGSWRDRKVASAWRKSNKILAEDSIKNM